MEIWREIEGSGGDYWVSDKGNVKSYRITKTGKLMTGSADADGYLLVTLYGKASKIHRLVATAFLDNPLNKPCVNHIDESKDNNEVTNLEWVTHSENSSHGTLPSRVSLRNGTPIKYLNKATGVIKEAVSGNAAAAEEGLSSEYFNGLRRTLKKENKRFKILD